MKAMDILETTGSIRDAYIVEAHEEKKRKRSLTRALLIAAVLSLLLLLVGCAVAYMLQLQDMKLREFTERSQEWELDGETFPATEWVRTELSAQGYNGSPEQLAMEEWQAFKESYDPEGTLLDGNNFNELGIPEEYYGAYDCYTFEMVDKLLEILEKYDLKPLGKILSFQRWEEPVFHRATGVGSLVTDGVECGNMNGYFFPEGSFHVSFDFTLPGEQESRLASYTYINGDYFYPYVMSVGNIEQWEQWHHAAPDGTDLLLATNQGALIITCQIGKNWIHITTYNGIFLPPFDPHTPMTKEEAEKIADAFVYQISPQFCNPGEVDAMYEAYPKPPQEQYIFAGFGVDETGHNWYPPEEIGQSFTSYIRYLLEHPGYHGNPSPELLEFCLVDLDQDGEEEVLLRSRSNGLFYQYLTMGQRDGEACVVMHPFREGGIFEGPVFGNFYQKNDDQDHETPIQNQYDYYDRSWKLLLSLRENLRTGTWEKFSDLSTWEPIGEAEAKSLLSSFAPMALDWKSIGEFPME